MSKSYRKPYGTWICTRVSEHDLKTLSSRITRHARAQAVREATRDDSWDSFNDVERHECRLGNEYDLRRDGHKRPLTGSRQYNNPYAYHYFQSATEEEIMARWAERKEYSDNYVAWASRK